MGNKTKWLLGIFGVLVIFLNAAETALFGATYLPAAFGNPDNGISALLAAGYCLLMLDVAYVVWFMVWLSGDQATAQRDVALSLAILALIGSIMATVTQLATNTTLAPYLIPYRPTIGTIAFFVVLAVTVAHIVGLAVYTYSDPDQQVITKTAKIQGKVIDDALKELEARAGADKDVLVDILAREFRIDTLNALGFTQELQRTGKEKALPPPSQPATASPNGAKPRRVATTAPVGNMSLEEVLQVARPHSTEYEAYEAAAKLLIGGASPEATATEIAGNYADDDAQALSIVMRVKTAINQILYARKKETEINAARHNIERLRNMPNEEVEEKSNRFFGWLGDMVDKANEEEDGRLSGFQPPAPGSAREREAERLIREQIARTKEEIARKDREDGRPLP